MEVQRGVYQGTREPLHRRMELFPRIGHVLLEDLAVYQLERLDLRKAGKQAPNRARYTEKKTFLF